MSNTKRKTTKKEVEIVSPKSKGLSIKEIERMFINRPLEPYVSFLACYAYCMPEIAETKKEIAEIRVSIVTLLQDTIQIVEILERMENSHELKGKGFHITNADNISAIKTVLRDQIIHNYTCMLKKLATNPDYIDLDNEELSSTQYVLEEHSIFLYDAIYKGIDGGIHLENIGFSEMKARIREQIKDIKLQIKYDEYTWINEVLEILISQKADFNNQLFQDIYNFCEVKGFISEEQIKLHSINTRPTAKSDYIRAAYNRLINTDIYKLILEKQ